MPLNKETKPNQTNNHIYYQSFVCAQLNEYAYEL